MNVGVILAAGLGTRMRSKRHKVVHEVCGKPMIAHIVDEMQTVGFDRLIVVVGKLEEQVRDVLGDRVEYVRQVEQLGTGHAAMQALPLLSGEGYTVVMYGDCPLVSHEDITRLLETAQASSMTTVMTANLSQPFGYGRIIRGQDGSVERIVEEKDATLAQRQIQEVNSGIYAFPTSVLREVLQKLTRDNAQGEYLLTDCVEHIRAKQGIVIPVLASSSDAIMGVNDRVQLSYVEKRLRRRICEQHMQAGVTIIDPDVTYIDADVVIGRDTVLLPHTHLQGKTVIGEDCLIGPGTRIIDSVLKTGVHMESSVATDCQIGEDTHVGPFAYIRPGSVIGADVKIGDFVEIKNATIGDHSKVSHLAYVGDSDIGTDVNMGCGVVTVNYDGYRKHRTVVGDGSFVGSNVNLIAPVQVGSGAYVATGSTVTDDVPAGAFAIARERQTTKPDYAEALRKRLQPGQTS